MAKSSRAFLSVSSLVLLGLAVARPASASGFQLRDQSGSGQGSAYAGVSAGGSDISTMFFNPATLTRYEGNQLQFGLTEIVPSAKFNGGAASRSVTGTPIFGATATGNVARSATLPTFYALWSLDQDLKLGLSVNVPFGLTTEYDPAWAGRYHAIKSHLETLDITPTVAYRMDPKWSVGAAFVARRAKAELSTGLDVGYQGAALLNKLSVANPGFVPGGQDGTLDVNGSSWAYGYKLGLTYDPAATVHLGLGYQSSVRETLKGTATFTIPGSVAGLIGSVAGSGATGRFAATAMANAATSGSVSAVVDLPATLSLGLIWDLSGTFSLAAEIAQTKWSCFKELRIKFSNPAAQPDAFTTENWKDSMFYAVGATCRPGGAWTYRAGLALDRSPVPDATRTPRIPDADRTWASAGVSCQVTKAFGLDAGYSHLFCKNSTVNLQGGTDSTAQTQFFAGNLSGTYKNSIDILAVQARYSF